MSGGMRPGARLVSRGFSQFAAAWFLSFGVTLVVVCISAFRARTDLYEITDRVLLGVLAALALGWFLSVALALLAPRASSVSKVAYVLLAGLMLLPLLWAPVLGAVVGAWLTGAAIEYSGVYAQFRIHVAQLLYPVSTGAFHLDLVDVVWNAFQVVATIIGFLASVVSLWPLVSQQLGRAVSSSEA